MSSKLGMRKRRILNLDRDPNDAWAEVELYRWQHGELPPQNATCKQLDPAIGLQKMAEALSQPDQQKWPTPFNVASVLKYAAAHLKSE
jgi:hypothetical protein